MSPEPSSRAFRLRREESVGDGLRRVAAGRAETALERLGGRQGESPAEAIHGARKDLKKLRAVLRLSRAALGRDLFRAENRRFRDAARLLSASRDAEVRLATLAALRERCGGELPGAAAAVWAEEMARERDEGAAGGAAPEQARREAIAAIAAGRDEIATWPLDGASWKLLRNGLRRSYRDGRHGWRQAAAGPSPEATHEWRKRAKDLWYQLRIVAPAWPAVLDPTAEQLHQVAEQLGDHHDLALLADDLEQRSWIDATDRHQLTAAISHRQAELVGAAAATGARLYAERPKAFGHRLGVYWKAWRDPSRQG